MHVKWLLYGALAFGIFSNAGSMKEGVDQQQEIRQEQAAFSADLKDSKNAARETQRKSELALMRVSAGFVPVYDKTTMTAQPFVDGYLVTLDNGLRLADGTIVANELGHTGEIRSGLITDIAIAAPADMLTYSNYYLLGAAKYDQTTWGKTN